IKERVRLIAVDLPDYDLFLSTKLALVKQRVTSRIFHKLHRRTNVWTGGCEVVIHYFFARRPVVSNAHLSDRTQVVFGVCDGTVLFEEHVLVQVRESVELRQFGVRTVLNRELDRDEWD